MALFTDGPISSISDLTDQDSSLLDVAETEGINLTTKLRLAQDEVGAELTALFERYRVVSPSLVNISPLDIDHLAVTRPIRLWNTYQTLAMVYRDAYYNQLNDRYRGKWDEFRSLAKWARGKLMETGAGIVFDPVPQAAAPLLSVTAGTGTGGTFYVSTSLLNAKSEEGSPSPAVSISVPNNHALSIQAGMIFANAHTWNVYVGVSPDAMLLQNDVPLDGSLSWQYTVETAKTGRLPGSGQEPNFTRPLPRLLQRG